MKLKNLDFICRYADMQDEIEEYKSYGKKCKQYIIEELRIIA